MRAVSSIRILTTVALLTSAALSNAQSVEPPPGMVLVEGGTTKIGTTVDALKAYAEEDESYYRHVLCETPQHSVRVEDFFLMVSEVTNEQYAAYVAATGARPPWMWGDEAVINEARMAFLEEDHQKREKAKAEGLPVPERGKFEEDIWWARNWRGKPYGIPKGKETLPATFVDYQAARGYARWAGLRLMTEFEYQRACRGNTSQDYPWGDDPPTTDRLVSLDTRTNEPWAAGALPEGASREGIRHLAGNVWEWTASPFVAYPKHKNLTIEIGKGSLKKKLDVPVKWDANQRVVVGGSFQNSTFAARTTVRRATDRTQNTDAVGFRCAASVTPGIDIAGAVMQDDVPPQVRAVGMEFDESKVLAMDRWTSEAGSAVSTRGGDEPLPGYGVITAYDYVMFIPAVEIEAVSLKGLRELSLDHGVVSMGVLSTTVPVLEPELPAGTYFVSFRGESRAPEAAAASSSTDEDSKGIQEPQDEEPGAMAPVEVPEGYVWNQDNFIFYTPDDKPVAFLPAGQAEMSYVRPKQPEILVASTTRDVPGVDDEGKPIVVKEPVDQATFKVNSWVKVSNKGFNYSLRLRFTPGAVTGEGWRIPR
jgi:formylglycine-generating enzyme required for sulfatase activity